MLPQRTILTEEIGYNLLEFASMLDMNKQGPRLIWRQQSDYSSKRSMSYQKIIPIRERKLQFLGAGYHSRYDRIGSLVDLETAIRRYQEALDVTPEDHPSRGDRLQSLGAGYHNRYDRIGSLVDLETAIQR